MRIAVTGTSGQVAMALRERGTLAGHEVITLGRPDLDLANPALVKFALKGVKPDAVVSAAAYTAVDKAESEPSLAHVVNGEGAVAVSLAAKRLGVPLVHVSTDYVFDGNLTRPYREDDLTAPTGAYGASKLAGERGVLETYREGSAVVRVAWVFSPFGTNFVKSMLQLAGGRDEVSVVSDQIGNPTSAFDIADGILKVAANLAASEDMGLRGTFHMTTRGETSWADFAEAIFAASAALGGPFADVKRITSAEYPTVAARPYNSRLDCEKIARMHGVKLPDWQASLEMVIARLQLGQL